MRISDWISDVCSSDLGYRIPVEAVHPFDPAWILPVYVANFVLMEYGTGAIFGCPGHDQRDLDFARKYNLPVKAVVAPKGQPAPEIEAEAFADTDNTVAVN